MKKLDYIDGLKGIGALMVFFCHFVFAFYYAAYSLLPETVNTSSGIERKLPSERRLLILSTAEMRQSASFLCSAVSFFALDTSEEEIKRS